MKRLFTAIILMATVAASTGALASPFKSTITTNNTTFRIKSYSNSVKDTHYITDTKTTKVTGVQ